MSEKIDLDKVVSDLESGKRPDFVAAHLRTYLESGGKEGHLWDASVAGEGLGPTPTLLLTTIGRKSGQKRTTPLIYGAVGADIVVIGSKGGSETHTSWFRNLQANPTAEIQIGTAHFKVRARIATGQERARIWQHMLKVYPPYQDYQNKTKREIPVVVLEVYVGQVKYEDLVEANRAGKIDARSQQLLACEQDYVKRWRSRSGTKPALDVRNTLTGLALSGGGIRSATFALGVTQALARRDLMRRFDYLSTVSGGGYLGASLTWLTRNDTRVGAFTFGMDGDHFPYPVDPTDRQTGRRAKPEQDAQLNYLRQHGKYLTPGRGIDIVSAIAVVLRGFLLNLLVWLPIFALALLALMTIPSVESVFPRVSFIDPDRNGYGWAGLLGGAAAVLFAVVSVLYSLATYRTGMEQSRRYEFRRWFEDYLRYVLWTIAIAVPVALLPFVHDKAGAWIESAGFASVLAGLASAVGIFLRSRSGSDNGGFALSVVAPVGALLTLYGMLILAYAWADSFYRGDAFWVWGTYVGALAVALVTGYFVNVNLISVHRFYRDRLMEAFLPDPPKPAVGSRRRYTDFATEADVGKLHQFDGSNGADPTGPYHLLNTNVILVNSGERNWRLRGGDSFVLSPLFCGSNATGWCSTRQFLGGDLTLATAMAISGAAANPYAGGGLFRNRPVALLMALANIRLGYWVEHPDSDQPQWLRNRCRAALRRLGPWVEYPESDQLHWLRNRFRTALRRLGYGVVEHRDRDDQQWLRYRLRAALRHLGYWVEHWQWQRRNHFRTAWRELSGKLDETRPMLQLSDGGHFDNLGIYELIRRRARLIVACDGTADPELGFSDFITLLARIEADFGARIAFSEGSGLEIFMPSTAAGYPRNTQLARRGFTVGKISYSDESEGYLIYITTTLFKGLGLSALGYKAANPDFPDQTTADQFFDEAQFEAYRHLGSRVGEAMIEDTECCDILQKWLA